MKNKIIVITFWLAVLSTYWWGHIGINLYLVGISTIVAIYIVFDNRHPSKTLVWVLLLSVNPLLGLSAYYLFGVSYGKQKRYELKSAQDARAYTKESLPKSDSLTPFVQRHPNLFTLLERTSPGTLFTPSNVTLYHHGKDKFASLFHEIKKAKRHIHLQYYAIHHDHLGKELTQLLSQKAKEGIEVRLIFDHVGSIDLKKSYLKQLERDGIHVAIFGKVHFKMFNNRINYRNHRKMVIIDGQVGFIGGINVGDAYVEPSWRDTHMKITGQSVLDLQRLFCNDWRYLKQEDLMTPLYFPKIPEVQNGDSLIKMIASGPDQDVQTIKSAIFSMITEARRSIQIATPYFIPDEDILTALKIAALSGVDVSLLMPSIPDRKISFYASRSFYKDLMSAGVHIYTYNPGFVHSKLLIIDQEFATVGTCNMDMRSFHLNFEVNAVLFGGHAIQELCLHYQHDLLQSTQINQEVFTYRPYREQIAEALSRLAAPML